MLGISTTNLRLGGFRGKGIDSQAQAHYNRVIADGGIMPSGLIGCNLWFKAVKAVYGVSDITTAIMNGYDPHYLGVKVGVGSGSTLGQAATKLYSCCIAAGDLIQATAASMPLLLVKNTADPNYWYGSGVAGNYCTSNKLLTATSEIDINFNFTYKSNIGFQTFFGDASIFTFLCQMSLTGIFDFRLKIAGSNRLYTSGNFAFTNGVRYWVRITRQSGGQIDFLKSTDGITYSTITTLAGHAGAIQPSTTDNVSVGNYSNTSADTLESKLYRLTVANTIGGAAVIDFNPSSYLASTSQANWTSATGETWTINKSSGSTFTGVLVDRTMIQGNNTTTSMLVIMIGTQPYTEYLSATKNGTGNYILRAAANTRSHSGTNIVLNNGTALNYASTSILRQLITFRNNGASSGIAVNNGTETTGNSGAGNGTTLVISEGAHNIQTIVSSLTDDTAPQRVAMYSAIRQFNGNAY